MSLVDIDVWAQFGLAGLVILTLFAFLWKVSDKLFSRFDASLEGHAAERKDWYKGLEERDGRQARRDETLERAMRDISSELRRQRDVDPTSYSQTPVARRRP